MDEPPPHNTEPNLRGCAGVAALLFAASPTVASGLLALAESRRMQGRPAGGGPVAIGVPPLWLFWLVLLGLSLPWILAGVLLLRHHAAGRGIALLLTLPTAVLTVLTGIGTIVGMTARDEMTKMNVSAFGPIALGGMVYCLAVWGMELALRSRIKNALDDVSP